MIFKEIMKNKDFYAKEGSEEWINNSDMIKK